MGKDEAVRRITRQAKVMHAARVKAQHAADDPVESHPRLPGDLLVWVILRLLSAGFPADAAFRSQGFERGGRA